jgi:hypothetical protein
MMAAAFRQRLESALNIPVALRRLAITGWLLYAISWFTPSIDARQVGATAFVAAVKFARDLLVAGTTWSIPLGLCVLLGWLANFSILLRAPVWARIGWSAAPWLAFAVVLLILPVRPSLPARAAFFLYFYPWAVGIALIHMANIAANRRKDATGALQ